VAILGGGLVGSTMAVTLARHGFRVALVDPASVQERAEPDFDGRAYAIAPGSRNLLDAIGVWEGVAAHAQPISRIEVVDAAMGAAFPVELAFDPSEAGRSALGWIVEDRFLRRTLLDAVDGTDVDHLASARADRVAPRSACAEAVLEDGGILAAALVVACDGRRSVIARAAGVDYLGWSSRQTGLVSAIAHEHPHEGVAHQSFFPGGPFAVLPLTGNRSALVWSERTRRAAEIVALDDAAYMDEIRARVGSRLGRLEPAGRRQAFPLSFALAFRFAAPRLAVVGDAAHGVHPIAGQGLNMGLRDVAALTEIAVEAARLGLDIGEAGVTEEYQRWRRFDATAMSLGMDGLNRLFSTDAAPASALRNLGLGAVGRLPAARRFFTEVASGASGEIPKLLAGEPI